MKITEALRISKEYFVEDLQKSYWNIIAIPLLLVVAVIFAISFGISRHLFYMQLTIFNKEAETAIYKKKFHE